MKGRFAALLAALGLGASGAAHAFFESYPGCHSHNFGTTRHMAVAPNGDAIVTGCLDDGTDYETALTMRFRGSDGGVVWTADFGDGKAGNSAGTAIALDAEGNVFVTGYAAVNDATRLMTTLKYDGATGAKIWASTYPSYESGQANAIAVDANGDVYVTGWSVDPGDNQNIRTVKYDGASGAQLWTATFNGSFGASADVGRAIVVDSAGHVFVTGLSGETVGASNFRTVAYDAGSGQQLWAAQMGAEGGDEGLDAAVGPDGNLLVTGYTYDSATWSNYRTIKYGAEHGDVRWTSALSDSPPGGDTAQAVGVDASGDVFVTGYAGAHEDHIRTVKLDGTSGGVLWDESSPGGAATGYSLAVDSAGNAIVAGYGAGPDGGMLTIKYGGYDGRVLWSASFPGDRATAVGLDGQDDVLVTGNAISPGAYGFRVLKYGGSSGALLWSTASAVTVIPTQSPGPLSGLWWNPAESGWGIDFTQRGNIVFAVWYTYDAAGAPKWYVASRCELPASSAAGSCSAPLYEATGPGFFGTSFDPAAVHLSQAGTLSLSFSDANTGTMSYSVAGEARSVAIVRQPLPGGTVPPPVDYTDLWWNPAESGWGLAVTHRFNVIFLAWFVYDASGKPTWLVASDCAMNAYQDTCSGALYRAQGPPFGASFDPGRVTLSPAGTVQLVFTDPNSAVLVCILDGVNTTKYLIRQLF